MNRSVGIAKSDLTLTMEQFREKYGKSAGIQFAKDMEGRVYTALINPEDRRTALVRKIARLSAELTQAQQELELLAE